jgi:predicted RNA methylase
MAHITLTEDIADVLRRSTITEFLVALPEQLERKLYEAVDKVLKNAGGRWKRGKGHAFAHGTQFLVAAMETGVAKDRNKEFQFYPTPEPLANDLVAYGHIMPGHRVLEPSAGDGALVHHILKYEPADVVAVEIREESLDRLRAMGTRHGVKSGLQVNRADFLTLTPQDLGGLFDVIVMNPPFAKDQDLAHIRHAWQFLKPGGQLVSLSAPGWTYSTTGKRGAFAKFVKEMDGTHSVLEPQKFGNAFIGPALLRIEKPKLSRVKQLLADLAAL